MKYVRKDIVSVYYLLLVYFIIIMNSYAFNWGRFSLSPVSFYVLLPYQ